MVLCYVSSQNPLTQNHTPPSPRALPFFFCFFFWRKVATLTTRAFRLPSFELSTLFACSWWALGVSIKDGGGGLCFVRGTVAPVLSAWAVVAPSKVACLWKLISPREFLKKMLRSTCCKGDSWYWSLLMSTLAVIMAFFGPNNSQVCGGTGFAPKHPTKVNTVALNSPIFLWVRLFWCSVTSGKCDHLSPRVGLFCSVVDLISRGSFGQLATRKLLGCARYRPL